jgi:hypothetical protein
MLLSEPISNDVPVIFSHPAMPNALRIGTGADSIKWSYNLISNVIPTYGGEIVQILGCNVGPLTVSGTSRNSVHLRRIYHWLRELMSYHGTGSRPENPAIFKYPTRGWSFKVYILEAKGFRYGVDQGHGMPWSITAHIVTEDDRSLVEESVMNSFNGQKLFDNSHFQVGFDPSSPLVNPKASEYWAAGSAADRRAGAGARGLDPSTNTRPHAEQFRSIGNNFERLIGAWSSGDYDRWSYDALADPESQFNKDSSGYWHELFARDTIVSETSGSENAGGTTAVPTTKLEIVANIVSIFEEKGIPGRLGVAIAQQESGVDADARQDGGDGAIGLFQTFPTGAGGSRSYSKQLREAFNSTGKVSDIYTANMQITAASEWVASAKSGNPGQGINPSPPFSMDDAKSFQRCAQWAQAAQAAGVDYRTDARFRESWRIAGELIEQAASVATGNLTTNGGAKGIVDQIFRIALAAGGSGVYVCSDYRPGDTVGSGAASDHSQNNTTQAARDIAVQGIDALVGPPSPKLDRAVVAIGNALGRDYGNGKSGPFQNADNINWNGYRIQIIWRTPQWGGHMGHIHCGVKKL